MDKIVRALTGLSAVDDRLSEREAPMDGLALALQERRTASARRTRERRGSLVSADESSAKAKSVKR
jgi:hypothetical protein